MADSQIQSFESYIDNPDNTHKYKFKCEQIKQATIHVLKKHQKALASQHRKVMRKVPNWEPLEGNKGEFLLAELKNRVLKLDAELYLSSQGTMTLLADYPKLFPSHIGDICGPLRLFLKLNPVMTTRVMLNVVDDYNELFISETGFGIESQMQESQTIVTVMTKSDPTLVKRCFSLFALLNSTEIFTKLPDREILIEIINLLQDNYAQDSSLQATGVLISLVNSPAGFTLKFVQSRQNRIMLKAVEEKGQLNIQFMGDIPCMQNTQRQLFKLISLFFTFSKQDSGENAWRFACIEAVSQTMADMPPRLKFDLNIADNCWGAEFASNASGIHSVPSRSQQVFSSGADSVEIAPNGREIKLIKNPPEGDEELFALEKDLDNLNEGALLQEVQEAKDQEASRRKIKMESLYQQAIADAMKVHENKFGPEDEQTPKTGAKTLDQLSKTKLLHGEKSDDLVVRKLKRILLIGFLCVVMITVVVCCMIIYAPEPPSQGLFLQDFNRKNPPKLTADIKIAPGQEDKREENPAKAIVLKVCYQINRGVPPSQKSLNKLLKEMYSIEKHPKDDTEKQMKKSGDFYNLMGRLYWYKIELDNDEYFGHQLYTDLSAYKDYDVFKTDWVKKWKNEACRAFEKAERRYQQDKYKSSMRIIINSWNPERKSYSDRKQITYATGGDAIEDIENAKAEVMAISIDPWKKKNRED